MDSIKLYSLIFYFERMQFVVEGSWVRIPFNFSHRIGPNQVRKIINKICHWCLWICNPKIVILNPRLENPVPSLPWLRKNWELVSWLASNEKLFLQNILTLFSTVQANLWTSITKRRTARRRWSTWEGSTRPSTWIGSRRTRARGRSREITANTFPTFTAEGISAISQVIYFYFESPLIIGNDIVSSLSRNFSSNSKCLQIKL